MLVAIEYEQVLCCCFDPEGGVVTCGEKHALFWKKEARCLVKKKGVFGRKATAQMLLSCSSLNGKVCVCIDYVGNICFAETPTKKNNSSLFLLPRRRPRIVLKEEQSVDSFAFVVFFPFL